MKKLIRLIILFTFLPSLANAADIFIDQEYGIKDYIRIEGVIEKGDLLKFKTIAKNFAFTKRYIDLPISINSNGGDIDEAIEIGRAARELLANISVTGNIFRTTEGQSADELQGKSLPSDGSPYIRLAAEGQISTEHVRGCYSACVLILYGGVSRSISDNVDQRAKEPKLIPTIGIHRPYYDKDYFSNLSPKEASKAYAFLEAKVRGYLTEMGAPQVLIDRMFFKSSNEVELIAAKEFRALINDHEAYFEEWLISKCGATTDGSDILTEGQFQRAQKLKALNKIEITRLVYSGVHDVSDLMKSYIPPGFTTAEVESLNGPIIAHNQKVWDCKLNAVRDNILSTASSWVR